MLETIGMIVFGYLLGSISSARIIGRMKRIDLRAVGSENLGAANVFREAGKGWGIITGLFDVGKGFLPVFLAGGVLGLAPWALVLVGAAAICGHNWPIYFGFRGGRGLATTIGATAYLLPLELAIAFPLAILAGFAIKEMLPRVASWVHPIPAGATVGFIALTGATWMFNKPTYLIAYAFGVSLIALIRSVPNIASFAASIMKWQPQKR